MKHGSDWYKREPQAYLGGVQGLTAKEHAVYAVVLDLIYVHGGSVNNDPRWIAGWISDMGSAAVRKAIASLVERGKLIIDGAEITQKRAKTEAKTRENVRETAQKHGKIGGKKSAEKRASSREINNLGEAPATGETQAEKRREEKNIDGGDRAHAREAANPPPVSESFQTDREAILEAIGADPISGMFGPNGKQIGRLADMQEARRWRDELGLGLDEVLTVIREVIAGKRDGPPNSFSYFTGAMQRLAGQKNRPALTPIEGGQNDQRAHHNGGTGQPSAQRRAHESLASAFARAIPDEP